MGEKVPQSQVQILDTAYFILFFMKPLPRRDALRAWSRSRSFFNHRQEVTANRGSFPTVAAGARWEEVAKGKHCSHPEPIFHSMAVVRSYHRVHRYYLLTFLAMLSKKRRRRWKNSTDP